MAEEKQPYPTFIDTPTSKHRPSLSRASVERDLTTQLMSHELITNGERINPAIVCVKFVFNLCLFLLAFGYLFYFYLLS